MLKRRRLWFPLFLILLAGCSGLLLNAQQSTQREDGSFGASISPDNGNGSLTSATGCEIRYRLFLPPADFESRTVQTALSPQRPTHNLVILAHGFLRNQQRMQDLAAQIAEIGYPVATLDFCNQRFWDGAHDQNARDMIALADHLGAERRVYAGFSAGGLSALLAAREDARALGVVTLDLVDAGNQGFTAARNLEPPLLGLAGAPTNCNALSNADPVFEIAPRSRLKRLPMASHCDFESPTDTLCTLICADPDQGDTDGPILAGSADKRTLGSDPAQGWVNMNTKTIIIETVDAVRRFFDPDPLAWFGWRR